MEGILVQRTLSVSGNSASLDAPIYLYRGDRNIGVYMTINSTGFDIKSNGAKYFTLYIIKPDGSEIAFEEQEIVSKQAKWVISQELIDEEIEVGTYDFQIRLFDDNKSSVVTLPPILDQLEIVEPIYTIPSSNNDVVNTINKARINYSAVTTETGDIIILDPDRNYIKTVWGDGDTITDLKMNKLEEIAHHLTVELNKILKSVGEEELPTESQEIKGAIAEVFNKLQSESETIAQMKKGKLDDISIDGSTIKVHANGVIKRQVTVPNHSHDNKGALDKINDGKINEWNNKANSSHTHDNYAPSTHNHDNLYYRKSETYTQSETNSKISEEIAKAQIAGGDNEIDLSAYATKEELKGKANVDHTHSNYSETTHNHNNLYAVKSSEHTHGNKATLDKINENKFNEWNSKANYNHTHDNYSPNNHNHDSVYAKTVDTYNKTQVDSKISEIELTPGPQGPKGDKGEQGPAGSAGAEGKGWLFGQNLPGSDIGRSGDLYYRYTTNDVYRKNGSEWQSSGNLKGGKGDTGNTGPKGDIGITPNITIGTVSTLEPGQNATVTKRGSKEEPIFDFGIPKGQAGTGGGSIDTSQFATKQDLEGKASVNHLHPGYALDDHDHNDLYYPKNEVYTKVEADIKIVEEILNLGKPDLSGYATKEELKIHKHAEYADYNHLHSEYAVTNHQHNNYANTNHSHPDYSSLVHNHNDLYYTKSEMPKLWTGTKSQYDQIGSKDNNTLYFIKES